LALSHDSYIEDIYKENLSDVVYHMKISEAPGYIYCVIEHVSQAELLTPFQVLKYQISIIEKHLECIPKSERKTACLPVVIPLIFYRGSKSPYPGPLEIWPCFHNPTLAKRTLMHPMTLIDLSVIPDEELKTHRSIALLQLLQKHIHNRKHFESYFKEWLGKDKLHLHISTKLFEMMITYALKLKRAKDPQALVDIIENSFLEEEEYQETMQTIAQYLEQRGHQTGIQLGRQEGMQLGIYEAKREDAKKMLAEGISREITKRVTGFSDTELDLL
jgi:predicted transposase/invertase (TIGR01784 family)